MADFFDKVITGINYGVNTVSENSKLFVEKTKFNASIKEQSDKKAKLAQQIGMAIYQMIKNQEITLDKFNELCDEIDACNAEIEELNIQLLNLQNNSEQNSEKFSARCKCGHFNRIGAAFCGGCGAKLK